MTQLPEYPSPGSARPSAQMKEKAIIVSAPSGAGKTTLVKHLLSVLPMLEFSVSAASRAMRPGETHGRDYYFIPEEEFRAMIAQEQFVEWQEVYAGNLYGTLKSELERIWDKGCVPIFDVDVKGGLNLKKYFGDHGLAIFIQPPSIEVLHKRLVGRGSETEESLNKRIGKAAFELSFAHEFDKVIVNDDLAAKCVEIVAMVKEFLNHEQPGK